MRSAMQSDSVAPRTADTARASFGADAASMVVFTAVDGTLCDSATGSWDAAGAAVRLLRDHHVPIVLVSDRCAAELIRLQRALDLRHPFIAENGAALFIPQGYFADLSGLGTGAGEWEVVEFGERRDVVCAALSQVAERLGIAVTGFGRLIAEQLAAQEGISALEASVALQREYDEPFVLPDESGDAWPRLCEAMRRAGFQCFRGRRFHHATGVQDPAHAVRLLISLYRLHADRVLVIGLGDDWTDRDLLGEVDVPIVVRSTLSDQKRLLRRVPTAYRTTAPGPAGWSEAVLGAMVVGEA